MLALLSLLAVVGVFVLAACGSSSKPQPVSAYSNDDLRCFEQVTIEERHVLEDAFDTYSRTIGVNYDGTEDICLFEPDGRGGHFVHYYNRSDGYRDYAFYAWAMRRSDRMMEYRDRTDRLSAEDAMLLRMSRSVDRYGHEYNPWSSNPDGTWSRRPQVINYNVTNIQYGSKPTQPLTEAMTKPAPSGYAKTDLKPESVVQRGGLGVPGGNNGRPTGAQNTVPAVTTPPQAPKASQQPAAPKTTTDPSKTTSRSRVAGTVPPRPKTT